MIGNKKGFEAVESTLLLAIKIIVSLGIILLMAYLLNQMFGIGMSFG